MPSRQTQTSVDRHNDAAQVSDEPPQAGIFRISPGTLANFPSAQNLLELDKALNYEIRVVSGNANKDLAREIASHLKVRMTNAVVSKFSDGETRVHIEDNVRGKDVFIVQPTSPPVNDHLMELLVIIDTLKRASAKRITAVIPYYGYGRQDRKTSPRVPITARLVADLIQTAGAHRVLAFELHAGQIQGFFNIPVDNVFAIPVFVDYLRNQQAPPQYSKHGAAAIAATNGSKGVNDAAADLDDDLNGVGVNGSSNGINGTSNTGEHTTVAASPTPMQSDLVVVSPDAGGMERARLFAKKLDAALAIIDKRRSAPNVAHVMHVIGDVRDKHCVIVDDMVDTAGTLTKAAMALKENGARSVRACCIHAVLSGAAVERIRDSCIEELVVTNSIAQTEDKLTALPFMTVLSVGALLAETISRVHREESVSSLFGTS